MSALTTASRFEIRQACNGTLTCCAPGQPVHPYQQKWAVAIKVNRPWTAKRMDTAYKWALRQ